MRRIFNEPVSPMLLITAIAIALYIMLWPVFAAQPEYDQIEYLGPPPDICWDFETCQNV